MKTEWALRHPEISSSRTIAGLFHLPKRNLGCAILVAAIEDYQSMEDQAHASAANFLFATRPEYREHYDWVVSMADGVNRTWLRDALDGEKARWDQARLERKLRTKLELKCRGQGSGVRGQGSGKTKADFLRE